MKEKKEERKTLSVKESEEYAKEVWDYAYAHKMNLSTLIRAALNAYMDKEDK